MSLFFLLCVYIICNICFCISFPCQTMNKFLILLSSMYIFNLFTIDFLKEGALNGFQVWKFFITFADVLWLPSFTLDEFIQALHDYVSLIYFIEKTRSVGNTSQLTLILRRCRCSNTGWLGAGLPACRT
jgi:hypothetical protein